MSCSHNFFLKNSDLLHQLNGQDSEGHCGCDHMVVGFTTTYAISAYHHSSSCEFESPSWQLVLDTTLCDKVCQWLTTGRWFSPGNLISSTNIENWHHYVTEILLNVVINTVTPNLEQDSSLISVLSLLHVSTIIGEYSVELIVMHCTI